MRLRALFFCLLFATPAASNGQRKVQAAQRGASAQEIMAIQGGCTTVCGQSEACIENRCVEMCRPACRQGMYCTASGECEALPEPENPILTEFDRQRLAGQMSKDKKVVVFADLGGVVGFGVRPGVEWGTQDSLIARVQLMNTGVMSHAVFTENEFQRFEWGFGTSFGYRHYEATFGNMRGFYYGGGLDLSATRIVSRGESEINQMLYSAAPFGEFGYRWVFDDFAVGFGPTLALRYPVASQIRGMDREACTRGAACDDANSRRFEGTMHFEIGWFQ